MRLKKGAEFQRVRKNRTSISSQYFLLGYAANDQNTGRLGIIASKRNAKLAVDRNRIKRLIRENFRHRQSELKGLDIVLVVYFQAQQASNVELTECLDQLFTRLKKRQVQH